jgi:endonuclease-3
MSINLPTPEHEALQSSISIPEAIRLLAERYGPFPQEPRLDAAHELVFTILSQHTSDTNSERAFRRLMTRFNTLEAVAQADVKDIEESISAGGLARVKAPRIKQILNRVLELNRGSLDLSFLREMPLEDAKAWLRQLPGIGPKSAGIILSFALGMPAMAIDTHIYRVCQRLGLIGPKVNAEKAHEIMEAAVEPEQVFPFHIAFITHGRQVCKAQRPRCGECTIAYGCPSRGRFLEVDGSLPLESSGPAGSHAGPLSHLPHSLPVEDVER